MAVSGFVAGVTDISAPVMRGGQAAAALTVPFVHSNPLRLPMEETVGHIEAAAREISEQLLRSDSRV
jgi:DNA-binding IclR family transcriptional regulator